MSVQQLDQLIEQALALKQVLAYNPHTTVLGTLPSFQWNFTYPGTIIVTSTPPPAVATTTPTVLDSISTADGQFTCELLSIPKCTLIIR